MRVPDGDVQSWIEKRFDRMDNRMAEWDLRLRTIEERQAMLRTKTQDDAKATALALGRIESDTESEKDTRRRSNQHIDERFEKMQVEQNLRFLEIEKGQTKILLWIASATGIITAAMYFIHLYFSLKGRL
jgi:hypothetical protein